MQQFFIESLDNLQLNKEQLRQCKQVLRMRLHDEIRIVDLMGKGVIAKFTDDNLKNLEIVDTIKFKKKPYELVLVTALIRSERLEWLLQKATEAGVDRIILWSGMHGVVRDFGTKLPRKLERFQSILQEAAEQSYRQTIPVIEGLYTYKQLPDVLKGTIYVADLGDHPYIVNYINLDETVNVITGPEGGFSEDERRFFKQQGYDFVSLGDNVFRAETAGIFICNAISIRGKLNV